MLFALLAAFALRVAGLGQWSLWYDETVSVYLARLPLADMLAHTAGDIHPPGYYALLHMWQALAQPVAGHGLEFGQAWVSVAWGMVMVALLYPIGVRTVGARAATVALWIAAINPFQLWYAQEVRMYTLGGALALLALYATLRWFGSERERGSSGVRWLALYALAVAAGLWSLYYFVFAIVGLGVASLVLTRSWRRWLGWAGANVAALLLFAPWLGVFWRQASHPPVPPWRVAWHGVGEVVAAFAESLTALVAGQSAWGSQWVWALFACAMIAMYVVLLLTAPRLQPLSKGEGGIAPHPQPLSKGEGDIAPHPQPFSKGEGEIAPHPNPLHGRGSNSPLSHGEGPGVRSGWALLAFLLAPLVALFVVTLVVTPLYHVRYTFLFSGVFALIAGAVVLWAWARDRLAGGVTVALLVAASVLSIWNLRTDPLYARDDHRAAVETLMREWRPGDVVLVNAGWAYTPLAVYWRTHAEGSASLPPRLGDPVRLGDSAEEESDGISIPLVRTGSVDGADSLGWGSADSDFFALSSEATVAGLEALREQYERIWHYRIYDTVSDPEGVIRAWLDANTRVVRDDAIAGRDFGRLELREFLPLEGADTQSAQPLARFGDAVALLGAQVEGDKDAAGAHPAGTMLYATLTLSPTAEALANPGPLATSLRLFDGAGNQAAQHDLTLPPVAEWDGALQAPLAVGIPADLPAADYALELILYNANDGVALPSEHGERYPIAIITVGAAR